MNLKLIKKLCSLRQNQLEKILLKYLYSKNYKVVHKKNAYIMAEGDLPICLIAHMDTVFHHLPNDFYYDNQRKTLWCPKGSGFDDRAGIYIILEILEAGYKPSIIFTDQEEKGGIGAQSLIVDFKNCYFKDCRALIELDRANKDDAVFYNCDNKDFEKFIQSFGFKFEYGSFSDISIIAPIWEIAAVNLSVGYEDEHSGSERLHCDWCDLTIEKVKKILNKSNQMKSYTYIPYIFNKNIYNDEIFEQKEEDYCFICSQSLKNQTRYCVKELSPYCICEECFNLYYK